jgi:hypothetical protein
MPDELAAARGIFNAALISIALWMLIVAGAFWMWS